MDTNAYVLLSVEPQRTDDVVRRLCTIPRALVRQVLGPYDIVVELSEDTVVDITTVVQTKIRPVSGITQTVTCVWTGASGQSGGE